MKSWRTGLPAFRVVAFGQIVSTLGNEVSGFALTIWAFEKTGSATALALTVFFHLFPLVLTLPFAGAMVDRSNRRLMMMLTDIASFAFTMALLGLQIVGMLEIWHLYVGMVFIGISQAFQGPAFASAMSLMVEKDDLPKASGALGLADATRTLGGPALGAILYPLIGLTGVLIVDILTFSAAFITLLFINVPQPMQSTSHKRINWLEEVSFGFRYIVQRPSLFGLMMTVAFFNFAWGVGQAVQPALILARGDEAALAIVRTAAGIAGLVGGLAVSAWGAPKRRIVGSLGGMALYAVGLSILGLGQNVWVWSAAAVLSMLVFPFIGASGGAIWQRKVDPAIQGKVLASRQFVTFLAAPLGTLVAGPLADRLLQPATQSGGTFEKSIGVLVGSGNGSGFALTMLFAGIWGLIVVASAILNKRVRNVEEIEHDFVAPPPTPSVTASSETMPVTA
jgi:MFS transporter, DHA3 family, macrolide efflux protein